MKWINLLLFAYLLLFLEHKKHTEHNGAYVWVDMDRLVV